MDSIQRDAPNRRSYCFRPTKFSRGRDFDEVNEYTTEYTTDQTEQPIKTTNTVAIIGVAASFADKLRNKGCLRRAGGSASTLGVEDNVVLTIIGSAGMS